MLARLLLASTLLAAPAPSSAQGAGAAASEDLGGALRRLIDRLRGAVRPAPPADASGTARLVSWNIQTFGRRASPKRRRAIAGALAAILGGDRRPTVLAAEEIANADSSELLETMLPRGWTASFQDTEDAMDNGVYAGPGAAVDCAFTLDGFAHPPRVAHLTVGDADFTLVVVHLAYEKGDASVSDAELLRLQEWVEAEAAKPGADPDFVIAGDFNLPTRSGKAASARASAASWTPLEDVLDGRLAALVDEPTSRGRGREAVNNYDHFLVSRSFRQQLLLEAGRLDERLVLDAEESAGARASDHFPIALTFRTKGAVRQGPSTCR
ncbi:MAG: hypothetical protein HY079_01525 [Elusimicrobia bacterium]|nr:hypothetical protein [Elusimicrobiota bacterium]